MNFALIYTTDDVFPVIEIKHMVDQDSEPTTLHELANGTKHLVSHRCVSFYLIFVRKATTHLEPKVLNVCHK